MPFGQFVIGPPGSGKTTYCHAMHTFLSAAGRNVVVVNLDPANDCVPYECKINVADLILLEDAMNEFDLGPNGGMVYCIEYLEKNMDWLVEKLAHFKDAYFLFDCPGQVELYTHHSSMKTILERLQKLDFRLACINLVDAHYCTDPSKYISALLLSLKTMIQLELPHLNVLSKVDLVEQYGKLAFNLEYYTEVQDLKYLQEYLDEDVFGKKYAQLNKAMCELVQDFSLVAFHTLCISEKDSMVRLVKSIDKASGYIYGTLEVGNESIMASAVGFRDFGEEVMDVQEKYVDHSEE